MCNFGVLIRTPGIIPNAMLNQDTFYGLYDTHVGTCMCMPESECGEVKVKVNVECYL